MARVGRMMLSGQAPLRGLGFRLALALAGLSGLT